VIVKDTDIMEGIEGLADGCYGRKKRPTRGGATGRGGGGKYIGWYICPESFLDFLTLYFCLYSFVIKGGFKGLFIEKSAYSYDI